MAVVFGDVVARAISYLLRWYPSAAIGPEVPAGWEWDDLLIVVADAGGSGAESHGFDAVRLTVEVSHPDQAVAHDTAQLVYAILRGWPEHEAGIYWRGTIARPSWWPDDETRTPLYKTTVALLVRGAEVQISPVEG